MAAAAKSLDQSMDEMFDAASRKISLEGKWALITGASSGIGRASACALATAGMNLIVVARRADKLQEIADAVKARGLPVTVEIAVGDVTKDDLYETLEKMGAFTKVDILINNAGLAKGKDPASSALISDWEQMMSANCMGAFRMVRACLPGMIERGSGHVVSTGSIAGHESYENGSVYCASKHALHAFMKSLRYETYNQNIRTTVVAPGFVGAGTEFSAVRFNGEEDKINATYKGYDELSAADVAAQILFAVQQPTHVNLDMIHVMPTCQGGATRIHRS